jgi:hypothetical protein
MNMLHHFSGHLFDLRRTVEAFQSQERDRYHVVITTDPAHVDTPDRTQAYAVAEFMLNSSTQRPAEARGRSVPGSKL